MSPDELQSLGQAIGFVLLGGYAALKARNADKQTKATGNGFAAHVKDSLARIESRVDRIETRVDHLTDRRK